MGPQGEFRGLGIGEGGAVDGRGSLAGEEFG